ncbi:hypothetical protein [Salinicoccus halodurans]|uniref:hypothetical protein n=1 Tax=Salinicoccus halodurans TaxID=407035 RepID=UPI0011874CAE|nr:hypothetical protein [Salinicoccus halodurans]
MERGEKHIIPREQYRRKRRVFSEEDSRPADGREFGPDESPGSRRAASRKQSACVNPRAAPKPAGMVTGMKTVQPETAHLPAVPEGPEMTI